MLVVGQASMRGKQNRLSRCEVQHRTGIYTSSWAVS